MYVNIIINTILPNIPVVNKISKASISVNLFIPDSYSKELGATPDDIKAAIFDSIKVSQAAYDGTVKLLEMKGE